MDRAVAWEELNLRVESTSVLRHSLAVEAVMRRLAETLEENPDLWGLAGLLHDIDTERVRHDPSRKGLMAGEILRNLEADPAIVYAVEASVAGSGKPRRRALDKALALADVAACQVVAAALENPEKQLEVLSVDSLLVHHESTRTSCPAKTAVLTQCDELGLTLPQVYGLSLGAMLSVSDALGL
jgi:uncharacterized protein